MIDCLLLWWKDNQNNYNPIEELMMELDGGSPIRSNRTQFIKTMVEFSPQTNLKIRLIYYPLYHSKYPDLNRFQIYSAEPTWIFFQLINFLFPYSILFVFIFDLIFVLS